jgi:hypothetical protein
MASNTIAVKDLRPGDVVRNGGGPRTVEAILTEDRGHFVRFTDGGRVGPLHGNIHLLEWSDA